MSGDRVKALQAMHALSAPNPRDEAIPAMALPGWRHPSPGRCGS
jgi:hypothetical protein